MNEKEFLKYLDGFYHERLRMRIATEGGKIANLMVQYESLIEDQWCAVVRYDMAHGFFHRDFIFPNGDKEKQVINIADLKLALSYAEQDIKDRWEFYKGKYLRKTK